MRRISIEVWSSDSKLFFVRIDPFPHLLAGNPSLWTCLALDAHDIGCQSVAVTATEAPTKK